MTDPLRRFRPVDHKVIAWVCEPDTTLRRYVVGTEMHDATQLIEAHGITDALGMATELWPDDDPWWALPEDEWLARRESPERGEEG